MEIMVWTANGVPARLIWEGRRYRVNDTPTPLSGDEIFERTWHPAMTHPLPGWSGWRFQAIGPDHLSLMFEVREGIDGGPWHLLRAYDFEGVVDAPPPMRSPGRPRFVGAPGTPRRIASTTDRGAR